MSGGKQNYVIRFFTSTSLLLIMMTDQKPVLAETRGNRASLAATSSNSMSQQGINDEVIVPKTLDPNEPTCEELREMWRFSKRQSRASEITNEIPTYRDPFAYNTWEPYYPTSRSIGGGGQRSRYRSQALRPVYGRVVHRQPFARTMDRSRAYDDMNRIYGAETRLVAGNQRRKAQFRFAGGGGAASAPQNLLTPQRGSFAKLKELVWTERAKELQQQRKSEEMAARAAVLKEITNGQNLNTRFSSPSQTQQLASMAALQQREQPAAFAPDFMLNDNNPRNFIKNPNILQNMFHSNYDGYNSNIKHNNNKNNEWLLPFQRQSKPKYSPFTSDDYYSNEN